MSSEQPSRDAFVAAIEAKIAAWKAVLDSYRAAAALDGPLGAVASAHRHGAEPAKPMDLPVGVFRDKGLKEAIEIYLAAGRRKQTNKEIAQGLQKGGIATTATNFEATVATALGRMKEDGTILRFPDGWDLAASYPDSLRNRLDKDTTPKKKRAKASAKPSRSKTEARVRAKPLKPAAQPGLEQRVTAYLQTRGSEFTTAEELAAQLKVQNVQVVKMTLGKMAKSGSIQRLENGRVRLKDVA